ncbi:flagellar basal body-associated FliL family protein [Azospirillum sp. A39]|uniref:flagellar basal body-associated FliL family protein n=1 Tax=Azospirillum sp. A39 TaxID=3462279 RepID=UPI0040465990
MVGRRDGEASSLRVPLVVTGLLAGLVALGGTGAAVVTAVQAHRAGPGDGTGLRRNYASLPGMSFTMAGAREMDLRVKIELDAAVDPAVADPYATRIADRLGDRFRLIDPERLQGAEGAKLLKSTIIAVVDREIRPVRVRDVLLESLVIR